MDKELVKLLLEYIDRTVDDAINNHSRSEHGRGAYYDYNHESKKVREKIESLIEEAK